MSDHERIEGRARINPQADADEVEGHKLRWDQYDEGDKPEVEGHAGRRRAMPEPSELPRLRGLWAEAQPLTHARFGSLPRRPGGGSLSTREPRDTRTRNQDHFCAE